LPRRQDLPYGGPAEELLDAIYYLTRQVARLEDLREKIQTEEE